MRIEHIVVDAASKDGTVDILREYPDVRWISEPDQGQADAFNKGLAMARGPLIGWLNADDIYEPGAIAAVVRFFREHPDAYLVNGHLVRVDPAGNQLEFLPGKSSRFWLRHFWFRWYWLNHPSTFYRKAMFDEIGPIDMRLHYAMDYDFYLRASQRFEFYDIDLLTTRMLRPSGRQDEPRLGQLCGRRAADAGQSLEAAAPAVLRVFAAGRADVRRPSHLVESFIGLREGRRKDAFREFGRAAAWWPVLPLLPAFTRTAAGRDLRVASWENQAIARLRQGLKASKRPQPAHTERVAMRRFTRPYPRHSPLVPRLLRYSSTRRSEGIPGVRVLLDLPQVVGGRRLVRAEVGLPPAAASRAKRLDVFVDQLLPHAVQIRVLGPPQRRIVEQPKHARTRQTTPHHDASQGTQERARRRER